MEGSKHDFMNARGELVLPTTVPDYSNINYWNKRYSNEKGLSFDWICNYNSIRELILPRLYENKDAEILILGCGNSTLPAELHSEGFHYITNIDYSPTIIEEMKSRYGDYQDMDFHVMDAVHLEIEEESINCIIDKGTLDCLICAQNALPPIASMMINIMRILVSGGVYICVSHGKPDTRLPFFQDPKLNWKIEIKKD